MALKKDFRIEKFGGNVVIKDAYIGVQNVTFIQVKHPNSEKPTWVMQFSALIFTSRESKYALMEPVDSKIHQIPYDMKADGPISAAYNYLKSLPEFGDAQDI